VVTDSRMTATAIVSPSSASLVVAPAKQRKLRDGEIVTVDATRASFMRGPHPPGAQDASDSGAASTARRQPARETPTGLSPAQAHR